MQDNNYDEYINKLDNYIKRLKEFSEIYPEKARMIAYNDLLKLGIIDIYGNVSSPYEFDNTYFTESDSIER